MQGIDCLGVRSASGCSFGLREGRFDFLLTLDPHFIPSKKSSLTKARMGKGGLARWRVGFEVGTAQLKQRKLAWTIRRRVRRGLWCDQTAEPTLAHRTRKDGAPSFVVVRTKGWGTRRQGSSLRSDLRAHPCAKNGQGWGTQFCGRASERLGHPA